MCLTLKSEHTLPRIALRNIVVYKFLLKVTYKENYITPYWKIDVMIPGTVTSKIGRLFDRVDEGIHSFLHKKDVKTSSVNFLEHIADKTDSTVLVKCIIPFGSTYYKGRHMGRVSLVSNKLKYIGIVND